MGKRAVSARSGQANRHPHVAAVVNRLSRIEGHVRAIKRMVEADTPCPEVLVQLAAVNAAVQKAARIVLEDHISSCLVQAAKDGSASAEWRKLKDALDRYIR